MKTQTIICLGLIAALALTSVSINILHVSVLVCILLIPYSINQVNGQCLCGNAGTDVCNCNPLVVKPLPVPRINPVPRTVCQTVTPQLFRPVGDRCSCGNAAVLPAIQPRPTCTTTTSPSIPSPCQACQVCVRNQCLRVPPFIGNLLARLQNRAKPSTTIET